MIYNVLDVCRYVINYSNEKDYGISNLKLQKILYFIQAFFLINNSNKCFQEPIVAWDFGPVVPIAYRQYKQFGVGDIPTTFPINNIISNEDKIKINGIIDEFSEFSASDLVLLTHKQLPWKNAYIPYMDIEITSEEIKEYFTT